MLQLAHAKQTSLGISAPPSKTSNYKTNPSKSCSKTYEANSSPKTNSLLSNNSVRSKTPLRPANVSAEPNNSSCVSWR